MNNYIPFIFAIIPSILLVRYFYLKDVNKPEPVGLIIKIFLAGFICTIPVVFIETIVDAIVQSFDFTLLIYIFFQAFIVAGLCEETMKLMVIKLFVYNNKYFNERMDGIVYTIVASLGFACLENIMYVSDGGLPIALIRSFTAVPLHAFCSGIMGYYIGKAKFSKTNSKEYILKGLIYAILIHGSYNFVLFIGGIYSLIIIPILVMSYKKLRLYIDMAIKEDLKSNI